MNDLSSILTSIKKLLGVAEEYTYFDSDIIMHINSVFMFLTQMGVGPKEGFFIEDDTAAWVDYIPDSPLLNSIKSYMYLRVKLLFDPPISSAAIESMNRMIDEFEWRINDEADGKNTEGEN